MICYFLSYSLSPHLNYKYVRDKDTACTLLDAQCRMPLTYLAESKQNGLDGNVTGDDGDSSLILFGSLYVLKFLEF